VLSSVHHAFWQTLPLNGADQMCMLWPEVYPLLIPSGRSVAVHCYHY